MTLLSFLLIYVAFAFLCACLYRYAHAAAGSPHLDEMEQAQAYNDMIFSFYGRWLARRYNAWEQRRSISLMQEAKAQGVNEEQLAVLRPSIKGTIASQQGRALEDIADDEVLMYMYSQRVEELRRERYKLNPYSALGLCPLCSAFWFYSPLAALGLSLISDSYGIGWTSFILGVLLFPSVGYTVQQAIEKLVKE